MLENSCGVVDVAIQVEIRMIGQSNWSVLVSPSMIVEFPLVLVCNLVSDLQREFPGKPSSPSEETYSKVTLFAVWLTTLKTRRSKPK